MAAIHALQGDITRQEVDAIARLAVQTARDVLAQPTSIESVRFVCFRANDLAIYEEVLAS